MRLSTIGSRYPATLEVNATVAEAARLMCERNVGCVIVMVRDRLAGIVTDRDLVLRVLCENRDPQQRLVRQVMSSPVITVRDDESPHEAAARMRAHGTRRLPIMDERENLLGIVTFDDLVHYLGRTNLELAETVASFPVELHGG